MFLSLSVCIAVSCIAHVRVIQFVLLLDALHKQCAYGRCPKVCYQSWCSVGHEASRTQNHTSGVSVGVLPCTILQHSKPVSHEQPFSPVRWGWVDVDDRWYWRPTTHRLPSATFLFAVFFCSPFCCVPPCPGCASFPGIRCTSTKKTWRNLVSDWLHCGRFVILLVSHLPKPWRATRLGSSLQESSSIGIKLWKCLKSWIRTTNTVDDE